MPTLHALCCGRLGMQRKLFFPDDTSGDTMNVPVPGFLIVHPRGKLLFDTGVDCRAGVDAAATVGPRLSSMFQFRAAGDEHVGAQLAYLGLRCEDVGYVANSHLHFDHCGCNALFPQAAFLVQRAELNAARAPKSHAFAAGWNHALDYRDIDGEHDVFGDGTVILFPTPGHTPGHQSLKVKVGADRWFVMTADACYTEEHLQRDQLPGVAWNEPVMRESMAQLRRMSERSDTQLLFGHDAAQWERLPQRERAIT